MTNDITILSCPQCGFPRIRDCGNGLYQCDDCGAHFDKDENIVLTEQEWLQTADTEQLAGFIADVCYELVDDIWSNCEDTSCNYRQTEKDYWVMWLKQPHSKE